MKEEQVNDAFGMSGRSGQGYVLFYRKKNLSFPKHFQQLPRHLQEVVSKEDEIIKLQWLQFQKELRTINLFIHLKDSQGNVIKHSSIKVDTEEVNCKQLHQMIRAHFFNTNITNTNTNDNENEQQNSTENNNNNNNDSNNNDSNEIQETVPQMPGIHSTRLRTYHPDLEFATAVIDGHTEDPVAKLGFRKTG